MKSYIVRYYADWTRTRIETRRFLAYSEYGVLDALRHMLPWRRNPMLLIDITEEVL